jgi:peptidoglycan/LPS O-acetylase OafA/YrhL
LNFAQPNFAAEQAHAMKSRYRPGIDGLCALSVLPVLFYRAFPAAVPAGFHGVDVFFVISGYLISCLRNCHSVFQKAPENARR